MPSYDDKAYQYCFIAPAGGMDPLRFQFMPSEISDSKSANYIDIEIMARSHPLLGYSSSGSRMLSFMLQFYMTEHYDNTPLNAVAYLRSLVYPDYQSGRPAPPLPCWVKIGAIAMWGVLTQCEATYKAPWKAGSVAYTGGNAGETSVQPMYAEVSVTFQEIGSMPWSFDDVLIRTDMEYHEL